jgi:hypothetical protein
MSNSEEAVRWSVKVSKETDLSLRSYLTSQGLRSGDRSKFIEQAVLRQVFERTVDDIHARNREADPAEIDAAIREVRTEKRNRPRSRKRKA